MTRSHACKGSEQSYKDLLGYSTIYTEKKGHYWVNMFLSEASTYKPLSPIELEQLNVTQQKSDQKRHWQNDLNKVLFPSSNITASGLAKNQKNKQFILPIQVWAVVKSYGWWNRRVSWKYTLHGFTNPKKNVLLTNSSFFLNPVKHSTKFNILAQYSGRQEKGKGWKREESSWVNSILHPFKFSHYL